MFFPDGEIGRSFKNFILIEKEEAEIVEELIIPERGKV